MGEYSETGIAVLSLTIVLAMFKLVEHLIRSYRANGNGVKDKQVIVCPNKVETLAETLHNIRETLANVDDAVDRASRTADEVSSGVDRLVEQHKATDGVETWKNQPAHFRLWERIAQKQDEMCTYQLHMSASIDKSVILLTETVGVLKENGKVMILALRDNDEAINSLVKALSEGHEES
jgi:hypothetical protein